MSLSPDDIEAIRQIVREEVRRASPQHGAPGYPCHQLPMPQYYYQPPYWGPATCGGSGGGVYQAGSAAG